MKIIFFKQTLEDFQYFFNHKSILNPNTFSSWFFKDPVCSATTRCVLGCNQIPDLFSWKLDEWGALIFTQHKVLSRCDCKHHLCLRAHRNVWAEIPAEDSAPWGRSGTEWALGPVQLPGCSQAINKWFFFTKKCCHCFAEKNRCKQKWPCSTWDLKVSMCFSSI